MKKKLTIFILILLLLSSVQSNAQTSEGEEIIRCGEAAAMYLRIRAPFRGLYNFDEYFKDLFKRSTCQLNDIDDVRSELKNQQALLRQHLEHCAEPEVIKQDRIQMYKLEAQLFYVRNFIDSETGIPIKRNKVREELIQLFAHDLKIMDETTANKYVDEFDKRYKDRTKKYKNCKEDLTFKDLKKKAKELVRTVSVFHDAKDEWKRQEEQRKREKAEKETEKPGVKKSTWQAVKDHLKESVEFEINKVEPKRALKDIWADFKKLLPEGVKTPTLQQAAQLLEQEEAKVRFLLDSADKKARYKVLYGESGDKIVDDLLRKLEETNQVIQQTYIQDLPQLQKCAKAVNAKQCI